MTLTFCETEGINVKRTKDIISLFLIWINELKILLKFLFLNFLKFFRLEFLDWN